MVDMSVPVDMFCKCAWLCISRTTPQFEEIIYSLKDYIYCRKYVSACGTYENALVLHLQ
jgi:hypothetical protein